MGRGLEQFTQRTIKDKRQRKSQEKGQLRKRIGGELRESKFKEREKIL